MKITLRSFHRYISLAISIQLLLWTISGRNPLIKAPVQTANPKNYGGKELHLGLGVNFWPGKSTKKGNILGIEVLKPIVQNKNNLQMKSNYQIILGYERSF